MKNVMRMNNKQNKSRKNIYILYIIITIHYDI